MAVGPSLLMAVIFAGLAWAALDEALAAEYEPLRNWLTSLALLGTAIVVWAALTRPSWSVWGF